MVKEHSQGGVVARVCGCQTNAYKIGNTIFISDLCVSDHTRGRPEGEQLKADVMTKSDVKLKEFLLLPATPTI